MKTFWKILWWLTIVGPVISALWWILDTVVRMVGRCISWPFKWLYRKMFGKDYRKYIKKLYAIESRTKLLDLLCTGACSTGATNILAWLYKEHGVPLSVGAELLRDKFETPDFLLKGAIRCAQERVSK